MPSTDMLQQLASPFPGLEDSLAKSVTNIAFDQAPDPYNTLLVHSNHMTVVMESHYGCPVDVHVLQEHRSDPIYSREIILTRSDTQDVVQYGLVRIDLSLVDPPVRDEILAGVQPLGRVLIKHNVLRELELTSVLKIAPGPRLREMLGCTAKTTLYGRFAAISCNGQRAVDVLEIPAPVR
jgi:chorismate-pyruvate lyase